MLIKRGDLNMHTLIPSRYAEPKWQAYVTPESKAFTFASGTRIRSLYELKQALSNEGEDIIAGHLADGKNDLADWVQNIIGDAGLAEDMRRYNHRWGLIVALERHLMRTLSMPPYVAHRWLDKAQFPFTFVSGETIQSLDELNHTLQKISDETVVFHRERVPNDISKWIMDVVGDYQLAEMLEEATNRLQMIHFLEDHLDMLREAAHEE
jgi:hypothetical protein